MFVVVEVVDRLAAAGVVFGRLIRASDIRSESPMRNPVGDFVDCQFADIRPHDQRRAVNVHGGEAAFDQWRG